MKRKRSVVSLLTASTFLVLAVTGVLAFVLPFSIKIVGLHALHAICALGLLVRTYTRLKGGWLAQSQLATVEVFWYFVVLLWPILYLVVYL